jgi:signal peptidase I
LLVVDDDTPEPDRGFAGERVHSGDAGATTIEHDPLEGVGVSRRRRLSPGVRNALEWVIVIGGAIVITLVLRTFAFQTFYIPSESMLPTLQVQDRIVVNKISDDYHVGDIVVFERPDSWTAQHDVLIKRIVGVEGQTLEIRGGVLYRDGEPVDEPYLPPGVNMSDEGPFVVPEDHVFVMGDNRMFSSDSRENGPVPVENIVGRAALRIWPLGDFGGL